MDYEKELRAAVKAAKAAGKLQMRYFGKKILQQPKGAKDLVTEADFKCQRLIEDMLAKEFPGYAFMGEESEERKLESGFQWLVDPLDGTANYSMQLPWFGTSIALAEDGKPVLGVVYQPFTLELSTAVVGRGSFLNGKRICVSRKPLEELAIGFSASHKPANTRRISKHLPLLASACLRLRCIGSIPEEACKVACGQFGAYYNLFSSPWDFAAAKVIVEEAGGVASDVRGRPWKLDSTDILVANSRRSQKLIVDAIAKAEGWKQ